MIQFGRFIYFRGKAARHHRCRRHNKLPTRFPDSVISRDNYVKREPTLYTRQLYQTLLLTLVNQLLNVALICSCLLLEAVTGALYAKLHSDHYTVYIN